MIWWSPYFKNPPYSVAICCNTWKSFGTFQILSAHPGRVWKKSSAQTNAAKKARVGTGLHGVLKSIDAESGPVESRRIWQNSQKKTENLLDDSFFVNLLPISPVNSQIDTPGQAPQLMMMMRHLVHVFRCRCSQWIHQNPKWFQAWQCYRNDNKGLCDQKNTRFVSYESFPRLTIVRDLLHRFIRIHPSPNPIWLEGKWPQYH